MNIYNNNQTIAMHANEEMYNPKGLWLAGSYRHFQYHMAMWLGDGVRVKLKTTAIKTKEVEAEREITENELRERSRMSEYSNLNSN